MIADAIAGVPAAVLPAEVRQAVDSLPLEVELLFPTDAIESAFGASAANAVERIASRAGTTRATLGGTLRREDGTVERRVCLVGTVRPLLEMHRLLHVALNHGEPLNLSTRLLVPAAMAGRVIGRGGETIREIGAVSGATLSFDPTITSDPTPSRGLKLAGEMAEVANALAQVILMRLHAECAQVPRGRIPMRATWTRPDP